MPLTDQLEALYDLKRDKSAGYEKPYKPALVLSLIDLVEQGVVTDNRFQLSNELVARYCEYLRIVGGPDDHAKIHYPFWHLCGDKLWMCYHADGQPLYESGFNASSSPSVKSIRENMCHASFDPELFNYLQNPDDRELIRHALISRYFPAQRDLLLAFIQEVHLPQSDAPFAAEDPDRYNDDPKRSAAFAKTVKQVYDFTCAASGVRFRFRDLSIVDACHIVPFSDSHNDHPTNGIALSKNHHWALDRHLISPALSDSGLVWNASPLLDDRIEGQRELIDLDGRSVIVPKEKKFHPAEAGIAWRMERLLS